MKRYLLCLFILLVGCKEQTEVINVYAINRLYSCEDTIYTTFKYDNDDKTQYVNGRKKSYDVKGNDWVIQNKIDLVIACIGEKMNSPQSPKCEVINGVIGAQFTLDFLDDDLRYAFEKEVDYPSCDIYNFRGYFKEKNKGQNCNDENIFVVVAYNVISKYSSCISSLKKSRESTVFPFHKRLSPP